MSIHECTYEVLGRGSKKVWNAMNSDGDVVPFTSYEAERSDGYTGGWDSKREYEDDKGDYSAKKFFVEIASKN